MALYPEHGKEAAVLVQNAEAALRNARASGQQHLHFSPEQHSAVVARLALEHKLRTAIERRQFELHYQPKVGIKSRRIDGVEALLRWRDPGSGLGCDQAQGFLLSKPVPGDTFAELLENGKGRLKSLAARDVST